MAFPLADRRRQRGLGAAAQRSFQTLRHLDLVLIASAMCLAVIGLVMVYSATRADPEPTYYLKRQLVYAAIGLVVMVICAAVDYRRLEEWGYVIYGVSFVALLGVRAVGRSTLGAAREITIGPLAIQPSEFAVLSLIVTVAVYLSRHEERLDALALARLFALVGAPIALVYLEPDLGTTIITSIVLLTMLVVGGVRLRYLAMVALAIATVFVVGTKIHLLHDFQIQRLSAFLHQDNCANATTAQSASCWQLVQAKAAIGAGGLRGTGLLQGAVTNTGFVPEAYADMIFSAVGEQLGFLGSAAVLGLFALMALRIIRAVQTARDSLGRLLCAGALAFVVFSVYQNVGMTVGIMPITGIPLPFISFGGSALFATFAAVGLVVNVELRRGRAR